MLLPEGGEVVAQHAVGKRKGADAEVHDAPESEDQLWSNISTSACENGDFDGLEYEEGGEGIRLAGVRGHGPVLSSTFLGKRKAFTDGLGLCSPGRWPPAARQDAACNANLAFHERLGRKLHDFVSCRVDCRALAFKLAAGQISDSPFTEEMLACGRQLIWSELKRAGCRLPVDHIVPGQPFYLAAVEELLRLAGDPDFAAFYTGKDSFAKGVRLGVDVDLPRVPAVFTAKTRWRVYDEEDANTGLRENYVSARDHADEVQAQFEKEAALGAMYETSVEQARADLGELSLASLGAIEKKDGSYRVLHDGTHGLAVNSKIRVQDQIRNPSAGDLRRATQALPSAFFVLSGDVVRAHRLVKVAQCDWKYQCCRTGAKGDNLVWVNCVGTFGIASAAYHWCRLMAGVGRSSFYLFGKLGWMQLVYVDDILWLVGEKGGIEKLMTVIFYYTALGLPLAWKKFAGGFVCSWVGFELSIADRAMGLTEKRASWIIDWVSHTVDQGQVRISDFRAVLGRLSFAFTALPNYRPLLGPLYAWVSAMDAFHTCRLPKLVVLLLNFLKQSLKEVGRRTAVGQFHEVETELFRTDARAEGDEIFIGGWALDSSDRSKCRWFSERIDHRSGRWLYLAGESYRAIASLELLATLVGVVLFELPADRVLGTACSAGTDNRGNTFAISRLLATKFPLCAFLLELAVQLQMRGTELRVQWLPRLQNMEADQLTNGDFSGFSEDKRLRFSLSDFRGIVLADMLELGVDLYDEIKEARAKGRVKVPRLHACELLKNSDPWQ